MKTSKDPRHLARIKVMQALFSYSFKGEKNLKLDEKEAKRVEEILKNLEEIDKLIGEAAPAWPINKINKIDLSILRQATFELIIEKNAPPKVVVDEAVELSKQYGSESSSGFVNGVLGTLIQTKGINA